MAPKTSGTRVNLAIVFEQAGVATRLVIFFDRYHPAY